MENSPLSTEEHPLTPDRAEALDKRRDLSHTLLVIAGQFAVIAAILLSWAGKDLTYSAGLTHPISYFFFIATVIIAILGIVGILLRRGVPQPD